MKNIQGMTSEEEKDDKEDCKRGEKNKTVLERGCSWYTGADDDDS
jgi:hypothetical protein